MPSELIKKNRNLRLLFMSINSQRHSPFEKQISFCFKDTNIQTTLQVLIDHCVFQEWNTYYSYRLLKMTFRTIQFKPRIFL